MRDNARKAGAALLASALALGIPLSAAAQTTMTGSQQTALLQYALVHIDAETHTLATMKNHISSRDIVAVSITQYGTDTRRLLPRAGGSRHAALESALSKATVADVDRNNGQSEDQSSLAEYLQHLRIDPNTVVAVDIDPRQDRQNPRVTVFYRR
ncbi:MAG: hypothetical protein QOF71_2185 [Candidatus Eremiobacteraeota bacterium]|jgi:hypothetical protein|nr:hypothetical protein [Candidatus Eremiobacteraeota bacterium]